MIIIIKDTKVIQTINADSEEIFKNVSIGSGGKAYLIHREVQAGQEVIYDIDGVTIIDFKPIEISLNNIKQQKKDELSQFCKNAITGGFNSTAYQSTNKIYDSTLEDQANITGNALSAVSKASGVPGCEDDKFYYHARGEEFVEWQASECLQLARDFKIFKEQQLIKNKQLQAYVDTLTIVEEVQAVTWDTVVPT